MPIKKIFKKDIAIKLLRSVFAVAVFAFAILVFNEHALAAASSTTYTPMEKIPGFETSMGTDFYTYLKALYGFMVWGVGVSAMLMIVIGGFMYITAAGNSSSITKAKGVITDALFGLVLALVSYLCLYIINPDLVNIKKISNAAGGIGSGTSGASTAANANTATNSNSAIAGNCDSYNDSFASAAGGDVNKKCLLKALASTESSCNPNAQNTNNANGTIDCGLMQVNSSNAPCETSKSDPASTITSASNMLSSNSGSLSSGNGYGLSGTVDQYGFDTGNANLIASYNGGTGAVAASADCPGQYKWNCPINPGGYAGTQAYVRKVQSLQKQCIDAGG